MASSVQGLLDAAKVSLQRPVSEYRNAYEQDNAFHSATERLDEAESILKRTKGPSTGLSEVVALRIGWDERYREMVSARANVVDTRLQQLSGNDVDGAEWLGEESPGKTGGGRGRGRKQTSGSGRGGDVGAAPNKNDNQGTKKSAKKKGRGSKRDVANGDFAVVEEEGPAWMGERGASLDFHLKSAEQKRLQTAELREAEERRKGEERMAASEREAAEQERLRDIAAASNPLLAVQRKATMRKCSWQEAWSAVMSNLNTVVSNKKEPFLLLQALSGHPAVSPVEQQSTMLGTLPVENSPMVDVFIPVAGGKSTSSSSSTVNNQKTPSGGSSATYTVIRTYKCLLLSTILAAAQAEAAKASGTVGTNPSGGSNLFHGIRTDTISDAISQQYLQGGTVDDPEASDASSRTASQQGSDDEVVDIEIVADDDLQTLSKQLVDLHNETELSQQMLSADVTTVPPRIPPLVVGVHLDRLMTKSVWVVLLCHGGYFAGCVYSEAGSPIVHKCFHRYVVRKKQGGRQASHDKGGGSMSSVGAQLRRHHEMKWREEVAELLTTWKDYLAAAGAILYAAPGPLNRSMLFYDGSPLHSRKASGVVHSIPIVVHRPVFQEVQRVYTVMRQAAVSDGGVAS